MNPNEAERDSRYNAAQYYAAAEKCSKYSRCSEKQAQFTISANYLNEESPKDGVTIEYPYSTKGKEKDTIQYKNGSVACTNTNANTTLLTPVIEGNQNHCYNCNATDVDDEESSSRMYVAEWGFPGVWFNGKSRAISYTSRAGWYKLKGKFCIPEAAKDVNQDWWNVYYCTDMKDNNTSYACNDSSSTEKSGCQGANICNNVPTQKTATKEQKEQVKNKITYNISANTTHFGMFAWNIDIKCFYALNSSKNNNNGSAKNDLDYTVRSVELDNLFPAANGNTLVEGSEDTTGRAPGFNWSMYAKNDKIPTFSSDPAAYRTWVQTIGYDVYTDEYLDYDIVLTKEDINN